MFFVNYITSSTGIILSIRREAQSSQNRSSFVLPALPLGSIDLSQSCGFRGDCGPTYTMVTFSTTTAECGEGTMLRGMAKPTSSACNSLTSTPP